ncbi:MAG: TM1802 family CRISPR-associated protein [Methanosphaera sp.]|nr:TM1802 family CRISPR-associated protein [Methanosphaera sp.]
MDNSLVIEHRYVLDEILVSNDKKASFLIGLLLRKLTHMEYKELKATPSVEYIKDTLSHDDIKVFYTVVIKRTRDYDAIFKELEEEAAICLLRSDNDWNITDQEASFYLVLGYTLGSCPNYHREVNDKEISN